MADGTTTGRVASPGKASGAVSIVGREDVTADGELPCISENEILLTDELLPSLIPLAENAAAVLTYETTSLTSKAAMVARGNGTPCVVGLESVEDIEDGDEVVVDAGDGLDTGDAVTGEVHRSA
ncbi:MAG: PEP-utilizing enzyme [Halobacteria archaeon]